MNNKFITLDAFRGVAALFVLTIHFRHLLGGLQFAHAGIAVDLFFVLSGFVICSAYERNLANGALTTRKFLITRAIRLYPLYFLALLIAITGKIEFMNVRQDLISWPTLIAEAFFAAFILPSVVSGNVLFPLNPPSWSIFFEIIANILYVKFRKYFTDRNLVYVALASGAVLVICIFIQHSINFGFSWRNGLGGFPRVIYSFTAGIIIYRTRLRLNVSIRNNNYLSILMLSMVALLLGFPSTGHGEIYEAISVIVVIPFLVFIATYIEPKQDSRLIKIYSTLGLTSYAIYILHVPVIALFPSVYDYPGLVTVLAIFLFSWLIDIYYDQPVRRWLKNKIIPD